MRPSNNNNNNNSNHNNTSGKNSGSIDRGGTAAGVTFANDPNAMSKCSRTRTGRDQWDVFRDRKLDEMKAHKLNVERRMQTAHNIDSQMYWSQRSDKLKRYPKHEALDPSWYTDNIYANSSIDMEDEDMAAITEKYDAFYPYNHYGINDYVHDMFERRRAYHKQHVDSGDYNYPKSRSCCFGSGYDERPKPNLMPKSSSFSASTSTRANNANNVRHPYRIDEEDDFHEPRQNNNDFGPSSIRKFYCWEQGQQRRRACDNERRKEIYHIDGDPSNYKRHQDVDDMLNANRVNTNCIRNTWQQNRATRPSAPRTTNFKVNNNELIRQHEFDEAYDEPYDLYRKRMPPRNGHQHHSFDEEYLIVHQNKSLADHYSHAIRRNYSDEMLSISRRQSQHSNVLDPIYDDECTKLLNTDDDYERNVNIFTLDDLSGCHRGSVKSKSALEVKPPKRYDDSSSDSTDLDLDDFNFDFEKYWNELDKTTTSSSSGTIIAAAAGNATAAATTANDRYDTEYRNSKCNFVNAKSKNINSNFKEKNINVDNYKKKYGQNIDVNLNDNDVDGDDDDDDDGIEGDNIDIIDDDDLMMDYRDHHRFKNNFLADGFMSPQTTMRSRYPANGIGDNDRLTVSPRYESTYHRTQPHNSIDDPVNNNIINNNNNITSDTTRSSGSNGTGGPISLINNIFSIYKPRKYSPVNCRAATSVPSGGHPKSGTISKCMNVPSTVRPLGAPYNDFMTSMKRPLTITPTCYTSKRTWGGPSPTIDQPYFKIIPEKTGLKISPLYRFGFDDDDSKLRLKCTARPLLFPI